MTVLDIYHFIDRIAPFESQADFDNSGALVGDMTAQVNSILFALDVTERVIDEAVSLGVDLIVTHHPIMFSARKQITDTDTEGKILLRLIRNKIALISAHTNLDQAAGGINDSLAEVCSLTSIQGTGYIRVGTLTHSVSATEYAKVLSEALHTSVRIMGNINRTVKCIGLCSGAGSGEWEQILPYHADAFISGEIKHNHALAMAAHGIIAFECGHYSTELPGLFALADALQSTVNQLQLNVRVFKSGLEAYT